MNKKIIRTILLCSLFSAAVSLTSATILSVNNKKVEIVYAASDSASSYWNSWISNNTAAINAGGTTLLTALKAKITQVADGSDNPVGYGGLWNAFKSADPVPGSNGSYIWDTYGGYQYQYASSGSNYPTEGSGYNREHSVPKSWFSENKPAYSDLVHLLPTDGKVNETRSNYTFGEVQNASYTHEFPERSYNNQKYQEAGSSKLGSPKAINGVTTTQGTVFEPDDQYKGDYARIYMYFAVRYGGGSCAATKSQGGAIFTSTFTNANPYVTNYGIALFKKWHEQDPVSQKEITRNNAIETLQGNRNPFVDHPEWAEKVFGWNVDPAINSVTVSPSTLSLNLTNKTTGTLTATVNVTGSLAKTVTWSSNNEGIATVSNGTVTAHSVGTATITATSTVDSTKSGTCTVTVTNETPSTLTAKEWAIDFGNKTNAVCQMDGKTDYAALSSVWNEVSESYKTLDSTQKSYITNPDSGPDALTKHYAKIGKERYDFIVGKYEKLEKFMTPTSPSLSVIDTQQDYSFIFVLVASSIVISGLFITRLIYKKKTR